jgi:hypothetical protein
MKVFISGLIQGSRQDRTMSSQDYRRRIAEAVSQRHPDAEIIDPWEIHPEALNYGPEKAKATLRDEVKLAQGTDVLIAYLPEASMGTALEMWSAYQGGAQVYIITPMTHNWVVMLVATRTFESLDDLCQFVADGGLLDAHRDAG